MGWEGPRREAGGRPQAEGSPASLPHVPSSGPPPPLALPGCYCPGPASAPAAPSGGARSASEPPAGRRRTSGLGFNTARLPPPPSSPPSRFPRRLLRPPPPPCFPSLYLALPPRRRRLRSAPAVSNVRGRRAPARAAARCRRSVESCGGRPPALPGRPSASGCWKPRSLRRRRLFRLPHRAKAAAILVRPSKAARGATRAAAAGAARWPHHLKRQERAGRAPRRGGGLGGWRAAGGRERRQRRRWDSGRAGDGRWSILPELIIYYPPTI